MAGYEIPLDVDTSKADKSFESMKQDADELLAKMKEVKKSFQEVSMAKSGGAIRNPYDRLASIDSRIAGWTAATPESERRATNFARLQTQTQISHMENMLTQASGGKIGGGGGGKGIGKIGGAMGGGGGMGGALMGMLADTGPIGIAVGALLAGGAMAFGKGAGSAFELGNSRFTTGGSAGEVNTISNMGLAVGQSPGQTASQAMQLSSALRGGSYGAGYLRGKGIIDYGPTQVDKATNFIKTVKALDRIKDPEQAIRVARDVGMSNMLWTRDLSPSERRDFETSEANNLTPSQKRANAHYMYDKGKFESGVSSAGRSVFTGVYDAASWIWKYGPQIVAGVPTMPKPEAVAPSKTTTNPNGNQDFYHSPGTSGLGPRGSAAIPSAWKNQQMDDAMHGTAHRLGWYN